MVSIIADLPIPGWWCLVVSIHLSSCRCPSINPGTRITNSHPITSVHLPRPLLFCISDSELTSWLIFGVHLRGIQQVYDWVHVTCIFFRKATLINLLGLYVLYSSQIGSSICIQIKFGAQLEYSLTFCQKVAQYRGVIAGQFGIESFYKACPMSIGRQSIGSIVPNGASRGLPYSLRGVW